MICKQHSEWHNITSDCRSRKIKIKGTVARKQKLYNCAQCSVYTYAPRLNLAFVERVFGDPYAYLLAVRLVYLLYAGAWSSTTASAYRSARAR